MYARAHIGNARPFVVFSWLARWLRRRGYEVTFVHNITDVNDKIYEAAPGASSARAEEATAWYLEDTNRFGLDEVDYWPKVTETMEAIVAFIAGLVERGFAYEVDGDVYFRVARWEEYGRLSASGPTRSRSRSRTPAKRIPETSLSGRPTSRARTRLGTRRGVAGGPAGTSSARPCEALLGPAFEIHGGGLDLVFPHHENELAQSRALGYEFARIWMHNGMLRFTGEKMSKSIGNVETPPKCSTSLGRRDGARLLDGPLAQSDRLLDERMAGAQARAEGLRERSATRPSRRRQMPGSGSRRHSTTTSRPRGARAHARLARPRAAAARARRLRPRVARGAGGGAGRGDELARGRQAAREAKDFARADELRAAIEEAGWTVRDDPDGYRLVPKA